MEKTNIRFFHNPKDDWEIRREALIDQIYRKHIFQGDFIHD